MSGVLDLVAREADQVLRYGEAPEQIAELYRGQERESPTVRRAYALVVLDTVHPDRPDELTRFLLELLRDEGARRHYVEAGLRRAAEFTWARTARLTLGVYREAMERRRQ